MKKKFELPNILMLLVLVITVLIYMPGLSGGFLFDDFPNLGEMSRYGDMSNWGNAKNFILNGFSGPTGRPLSLVSFLLTAASWPENAMPFKVTNLIIHLICGVLLYWVVRFILRNYNYTHKHEIWIALITASIWLVHPYFVSTTLYVVQRMAQLAMLFSLLGMLGYLYGRTVIATQATKAYLWMTASIVLGTILATFSKENGALLPLLILVIEFCNPNKINRPIWQWRMFFLWLPSVLILIILGKEVNFSDEVWLNRNFNQIERLLSEARIIVEYIYRLYIPNIEGMGLYQDGYVISKSLLQPITTLYSILFLSSLLVSALILRVKYPLYSLAILFFFAAHLMESTVLGLELYFEHRNYFAAMLLFLPLASGLFGLGNQIKPKVVFFIVGSVIFVLSIFTFQRALLWSNTTQLKIYWAQNNPNSPRAQIDLARYLLADGQDANANELLERTIKKRPDSSLLTIRFIRQKIDTGDIKLSDFQWMQKVIINQRPEGQATLDLRHLVNQINVDPILANLYGSIMIEILDQMFNDTNSRWRKVLDKGLFFYLKAQLLLAQGKNQYAYENYLDSLDQYKDVEAGLGMVIELANTRNYSLALNLLEKVESIYSRQTEKSLHRSRQSYDEMIIELKQKIQNDMKTRLNKAEMK